MTNHSLPQITEMLSGGRTADSRADRPSAGNDAPSPASVEQFEAFLRSADRRREFAPAGQRSASRGHRPNRGSADPSGKQEATDRAREQRSTAHRSSRRDDGSSPTKVHGRHEADKGPEDVDDRAVSSRDQEADEADRPDDAGATEDNPTDGNRDGEDARDDTGSIDESASDPAAALPESEGDGIEADVADLLAGEVSPDGSEVAAGTAETSAVQASAPTETDVTAAESTENESDETSRSEASGDDSEAAETEGRPTTPTSPAAAPSPEQTVVSNEAAVAETVEDSVPVVVDGPATGSTDQAADAVGTADDDGSTPLVPGRSTAAEGSTVADASTTADDGSDPAGDDAATDPDPPASDSGGSADSQGPGTGAQTRDTASDVETAVPATGSVQNGSGISTSGTAGAASSIAVGETTGAGDGTQTAGAAGTSQAEQSDGTDPLWRQVRRALGSLRNLPTGEQQLTIRLRPDDLGSVVVRISTGDAGTTVALVAESAAAANQLNQQRQQLISELRDGGLRGVSVDVGTGDDAGRSEGDEADADVEQSGVDGGVSVAGRVNADGELLRSYRGRPGRGSSEGLIDVDL